MSTRANIILKDDRDELIFYRHSDGYPDGAMPTLKKFLSYVKQNRIRDNVGQAAGWLILLGREEYAEGYSDPSFREQTYYPRFGPEPPRKPKKDMPLGYGGNDWKIGSIEPTTQIHGDIEYFYVVDLAKKAIRHCKAEYDADYNATVPKEFYNGRFQSK